MRYLQKTRVLLFRCCWIFWSMQLFYCKFNRNSYFDEQVKILHNYELVTPAVYNSGDLNGEGSSTIIQIDAFGRTYDIVLNSDDKKKARPSFQTYVEYVSRNKTYQGKYVKENDCSFSGSVKMLSHDTANVVLNYCNGIEGMIQTNDSLIFIEPLRNTKTRQPTINQQHVVYKSDAVNLRFTEDIVSRNNYRQKRSLDTRRRQRRRRKRTTGYQSFLLFINKSGRVVVLYYLDAYKRAVPLSTFADNEERRVNTYSDTEWIVKDQKTERRFLLNNKTKLIAPSNTASNRLVVTVEKPKKFEKRNSEEEDEARRSHLGGEQYHIEVMVVADISVIEFHGRDRVEQYILTMMDVAARVFEHESLGMRVNLITVKVHLLEDVYSGFEVYHKNPARTLRSACSYISSLRNEDENHPNHFDFGIALSRNDFGPSGFTRLYSMCSESRSCALVQDQGLSSAFVVAHETGHLLGLEHDGESDAAECVNEGPMGAIMAPIIQSKYNQYRWSRCSREALKENIEYFKCVKNRPSQRLKRLVGHGSLYTLSEQCQFNFDRNYDVCGLFSFNPCRELFCRVPNSNKCTRRGPALQGTVCAKYKYCMNGECIAPTDKLGPSHEEDIVNGNWGIWSPWSQCSRTCAVGIRTRLRECDSPKNSRSGKPCSGKSIEKEICNTNVCNVEIPLAKQVNTCKQLNGDNWTVYTDQYFDKKLQRTDPKCSFESKTLCTWENEHGNDIDWTINRGGTRSFNTGPSVDHTSQTSKEGGYYLYVEASSTRVNTKERSDSARLASKDFNVPRVCFTMFYHMFGQNMGKLNVKMRFRNDTEVTLWTKAGNQGDKWHDAEILIETTNPYKLIIEAVRGKDWSSDIAIDDLSAKTGFCSSERQSNDRCKIACRSLDAREFRMSMNVTDGERCGEERSSNICLSGKCIEFGCDNKFGSTLQLDNCALCGGDGSTCEEVKTDTVKEYRLKRGYQSILTIDKGSTYINVFEWRARHTYSYGVKKKNSSVRKWVKEGDGYVVLANSVFKFERIEGNLHITSDGPISEDIEIIIYNYQQYTLSTRLGYTFYKPKSANKSYAYITKGWGACSTTCGVGRQVTEVTCVQIETKIPVDDAHCKDLERPLYQYRQCNKMMQCPKKYTWLVGEWQNCSKSCGSGVRQRKVECIFTENNTTVLNKMCSILLSQVPRSRESCNVHECPKWATELDWSECTASCGIGIKQRVVKCIDQTSGDPLNDTECSVDIRPDAIAPCNTQPCENYGYIIHSKGECSVTCGGGRRLQIVFCVANGTKEHVENKYCIGPSPPIILNCNENPCPEYDWTIASGWTPCSKTCGTGVRLRKVICIDQSSGQPISDAECPHVTKPAETEICNTRVCQGTADHHYNIVPASVCSATCGGGQQPQFVFCVNNSTGNHVDNKYCQGLTKPPNTLACMTQPCPKSIWQEEEDWGDCTKTCGSGNRFKKITCVDSYSRARKDEKECEYMKRPITAVAPCNTHTCDSYFYEIVTDLKCTKVCGGGQRQQFVFCVNNSTKERVDNVYCSDPIPVPTVIKCNTHPCPPKPVWKTENWSRCSKSCGAGHQKRIVICVNKHTDKQMRDVHCHVSTKPDVTRLCNTQACEKYVYNIMDGGMCTKSCGGGKTMRVVFCVKEGTYDPVDNVYCKGPTPAQFVPCNLQACPQYVWRMDSGLCSRSCGLGTIINTASCYAVEKHLKVDDTLCDSKKPTIISNTPCNVAKCPEYEWQVSDLTACSRTCGNGTAIRQVSCIDKDTNVKTDDTNCRPDVKPEELVPCFVEKCKTYTVKYAPWGNCSSICGTGLQTRSFKCLDGASQLEVPAHFCVIKEVLKRRCRRECPQAERLYCDFTDRTFCSWSKAVGPTHYDWLIGNSTSYNIPGNGGGSTKPSYFAYAEGAPYTTKTAVLYSPHVSIPRGCLSFKYIKHGKQNAAELRVKLLSSTNIRKVLFKRIRHHGQQWVSENIPIKMNGTYRVLFESRRGRGGAMNGIAINDIKFQAKDCASTKKSSGVIPRGCREISHFCKNSQKQRYCKLSAAFRTLCCKTCSSLLLNR